ncbi:hypothetical protein [Nonomuraea pusilla]|uniref:Uncharacterized protein n=1 Tax=Nonomuraea pusilla TaxID=46177 RepID=A0A1H8IZF7_9ACTN|nr:hypothetical protein [Nonomuraea pusilla]SEN73821.1 hypothetical protein SAMN05660976_08209 [Nonomuraea pusilla]
MTPVLVRRGLVALTGVGVLATAFELTTEQHWRSLEQLVPWGALGLLAVAVVLAAAGDAPPLAAGVRVIALVVLLASAFGVYAHVAANFDAGPLDQAYAATWDGLSALTRRWYAFTKAVGPAPPLAPGMLGQSALLLLLATLIRRSPVPAAAPTTAARV